MARDKKFKNQSGNSLIEMVMAISIFSVLMLAVTGIFQAVLEGQANSISAQNTQESLRFAFEIMSKEIRHARKSEGDCDIPGGSTGSREIYNFDLSAVLGNIGPVLYFRNKDGQCVYYYLKNDASGIARLTVSRDSNPADGIGNEFPITPDEIVVSEFDVFIDDNAIGALPDDRFQPIVTFKVKLNSGIGPPEHTQETVMQTSVSARYY